MRFGSAFKMRTAGEAREPDAYCDYRNRFSDVTRRTHPRLTRQPPNTQGLGHGS